LFKKFKIARNRKRFISERAVLADCSLRLAARVFPEHPSLSHSPFDERQVIGAITLAHLMVDPSLVEKAFKVPAHFERCHRVYGAVFAGIILGGTLRFGQYVEEDDLQIQLLGEAAATFYNEIDDEDVAVRQRALHGLDLLTSRYRQNFESEDQTFGAKFVSFILCQDESSFRELEPMRESILSVFPNR